LDNPILPDIQSRKQMQTEATEMYLITVYRLTRKAPRASTKQIASMLDVSPPSVSERIKRLAEQGLLNHEWREGTTLTAQGERIAINVLRKHRLIETFLVDMAGYGLDEIHDEACKMEHAISERLADQLAAMLGNPQVDPHGHPIPSKQGAVTSLDYQSLADVAVGESVIVRQVSDWDREQLSYLTDLGLIPGTAVTVLDRAPFDGPLTLKVADTTVALSRVMAGEIGV
jgi:DtxR family Mn-dependent transcriptional regulator